MKAYLVGLLLSTATTTRLVSSWTIHGPSRQHRRGCTSLEGPVKSFTELWSVRTNVDTSAASTVPLETTTTENQKVVTNRLNKLDQAMRSFPLNGTAGAAFDLLTELKTLRETMPPTASSRSDITPVEVFLIDLLRDGPDRPSLPLWSKFRPLTRFSRRARLVSLRRTLNLMTPPPSQDESSTSKTTNQDNIASNSAATVDDTDDPEQRRRRRALIQVLRTLSTTGAEFNVNSTIPAIRQIEQRAQREALAASRTNRRSPLSLETLKQCRPVDLETPTYHVVDVWNNVEIRDYDAYAVCSVSMNQAREADLRTDAAVNEPAKGGVKAFGALAGYLFGKNVEQTAMKMTSPVLTTEDERMSFVLRSVYWNEPGQVSASATVKPPQPLPGSGVTIERVPGETRAVLLFGGYAVNVDQRKQDLLQQVASSESNTVGKQSIWEIAPDATPVLAQYNDPFTPPWKRLNEVSVAVRRRS